MINTFQTTSCGSNNYILKSQINAGQDSVHKYIHVLVNPW